MNELIPFNYNSYEIRVVKDETGELWLIAKDVCDVLEHTNVAMAVKSLDDDEKGIRKVYTLGGEQALAVVNEAGLYTLIIRSNKPEAKRFKRWITHEVIPSIRKTGKYDLAETSELDLIIRSAQALKGIEQKQLEHENRLKTLEAKAHQNSGHTGYWTITAWCRLNSLNLSIHEANSKGREAVKLSNKWCVDIGKVADERFGSVNSYREDILEEVFSDIGKVAA